MKFSTKEDLEVPIGDVFERLTDFDGFELDVRPKTLPARLLMQSAKLTRNTLNKRYKTRIGHFAEDLEDRYKRSAKPNLG